MRLNRAEVVMVDWPFSDRTGSKVRPAVVVQADFLNALIADTVLLSVTRVSRKAAATEVLIDPTVETACGLPHASVVSCNNILTVDQAIVRRVLGRLSARAKQRIEDGIKTALALP